MVGDGSAKNRKSRGTTLPNLTCFIPLLQAGLTNPPSTLNPRTQFHTSGSTRHFHHTQNGGSIPFTHLHLTSKNHVNEGPDDTGRNDGLLDPNPFPPSGIRTKFEDQTYTSTSTPESTPQTFQPSTYSN